MNYKMNIVLENRTPKSNGKFPIKLRITSGKKQRYFNLPMSKTNNILFEASKEEWLRIQTQSPRGSLHDIKLLIPKVLEEAQKEAQKIQPFSFEEFRDRFYGQGEVKNLFGYFGKFIKELTDNGRVSTAQSYQSAYNSFKGYDPGMDFNKVTPDYLTQYENWFVAIPEAEDKKPRSATTVGIYCRCLRTIFNLAISDGVTTNYPFGRGKFTPPAGSNIKKALALDDIKKIIDFETVSGSPMDQARDLWIFSYFSNGMNFKDICSIREKDVKISDGETTIEFVRAKTQLSTKGNQKKIEVLLVKKTEAIIEKWAKFKGDPENYIFPFFKKGFSPLQKRTAVQNLVKTTNKYLSRMCVDFGLEKITTYHARHSYASILKESGAPVEFISESLGHSDIKTTDNYLKSFSIKHKRKWAEALRGQSDDPVPIKQDNSELNIIN
ncbi:MAG: site-specific integrase [Bacteroidales bacterium]|nr:site-specific integrase [Bacteroidales bacterium]